MRRTARNPGALRQFFCLLTIIALAVVFAAAQAEPTAPTDPYGAAAQGGESGDQAKSGAADALPAGVQTQARTSVAVIAYKNFFTDEDLMNGALNNDGSIQVSELEADLKYLSDNQIRTITCRELIQFWNGTLELPERCVLISVDDGHYSIYKYLVPLLKAYNLKANVAIVGEFTDRAANRTAIPQRNYFMTWNEVAELAQLDFLDIGVHSYYMHRRVENGRQGSQIMENESPEDYRVALQGDARLMKQKLGGLGGYAPVFYVYPYGDASRESIPILAEEGFKVLIAGNSIQYSPTKGSVFHMGVGEEQSPSRLMRGIARRSGDNLAFLLDSIWNESPVAVNPGVTPISVNDFGSISVDEGMTAPEITGITRLNDRLVVLTYAQSEGAELYRIFRSSNGRDFIQAAAVRDAYYYDWNAPIGEAYTYCVVAQGASGDNGPHNARSRAQAVGFNARPVTNVASLMYHRFSSDEEIRNGAQNDSNRISPEELESDLRYFRDNNIRTITCRELVQFWNGELELPERCVLITVDDGHYSIYKHMVPMLEKYGCKANIAVIGSVTDWAESRTEIPQHAYYLKWEEIAELGRLESMEFGAHSYYLHKRGGDKRNGTTIMENESLEAYRAVLLEDARLIGEKLASASGYEPLFYVYPYGVVSPESIPILTEEGGYRVLLAGGSPSYYPTKGRAFAFGIGEEQLDSRLFRRFERYSGKDVAALLEAIWSDGNSASASVTAPDGQEETTQY